MAAITGLGKAIGNVLSQTDAAAHAAVRNCETDRQKQLLARAYALAGPASRSVVLEPNDFEGFNGFYPASEFAESYRGPSTADRMELYSQVIAPLAVKASRAAIADDDGRSDLITHLITVSCTGFYAPGFDIELINELGLRNEVARTHVGFMGCHGALNGLRIANCIAQSDPDARVLLCAAEACSLHYQYKWNRHHILANSLFADGAAAVVVRNIGGGRDGTGAVEMSGTPEIGMVAGARKRHSILSSGAYLIPNSKGAMTWNIGDNGFQMTLSSEVPGLILQNLPAFMDGWLGKNGLSVKDISAWCVHPGGPRILSAVAEALNVPIETMDASYAVLAELGNMSSPTVLFVYDALRNDLDGPCVMLGFGPGLAVEAALIGP